MARFASDSARSAKQQPEKTAVQCLPAFVVAGTHSGVGKTTVTLGILAALRRRGYAVQPFKIGPDFIDPGLHRIASGTDSYNLDGWMLSKEANLDCFQVNCEDKAAAVVEGVMGLFDGYDGESERGSTAEMAKWLRLPVILVVDAATMARSAAAVVLGFANFDPAIKIAGVIFNGVGGAGHLAYLNDAMRSVPGIRVLGALPYDQRLLIHERHLGLTTAEETGLDEAFIARLADWIEGHTDLDALLHLTRGKIPAARPSAQRRSTRKAKRAGVRLAIARDEAFCFYYADNLKLLNAAGAQLVPFSPMRDEFLPAEIGGICFGGGYPELHAAALANNASMRESIREFVEAGGIVYAECGGLMYLCEKLVDVKGNWFRMVGIFRAHAHMLPQIGGFGYRDVETTGGSFFPAGLKAKGHEFHFSELRFDGETSRDIQKVYRISAPGKEAEDGLACKNCLASYSHLHFGSNPEIATSIVDAAARFVISKQLAEMKTMHSRDGRRAARRSAEAKTSSKQ